MEQERGRGDNACPVGVGAWEEDIAFVPSLERERHLPRFSRQNDCESKGMRCPECLRNSRLSL